MTQMILDVDALIFDKDGTLFDFGATWNTFGKRIITALAEGDPALEQRLAAATHYDLAAQAYLPTSPVIAGTNREAVELIAPFLPHHTLDELEKSLMQMTFEVPQIEVVPLRRYFERLHEMGKKIGVVTNDTERGARVHLERANCLTIADFVAGYDSGYGAKPAPDPLLACARSCGVDPTRCAMVGDSTHDLRAGRAAGMTTIGVLTGMALREELVPFADLVLDDIGEILALLKVS